MRDSRPAREDATRLPGSGHRRYMLLAYTLLSTEAYYGSTSGWTVLHVMPLFELVAYSLA